MSGPDTGPGTAPGANAEGGHDGHGGGRAAKAAVQLREMRWWDIAPVLALEHELFPEDAWSAGMFWSELADARHPGATRWYTVAEDAQGALVGYAGLMAVADSGDVQTIASHRAHWGSGLGARLLTTLVRQAAAARCTELLLEVRVDNARAQRLYERFGFQVIGIRRDYYQPSGVDALVMRLDRPGEGLPARDPNDTDPNDVGALSHDG